VFLVLHMNVIIYFKNTKNIDYWSLSLSLPLYLPIYLCIDIVLPSQIHNTYPKVVGFNPLGCWNGCFDFYSLFQCLDLTHLYFNGTVRFSRNTKYLPGVCIRQAYVIYRYSRMYIQISNVYLGILRFWENILVQYLYKG